MANEGFDYEIRAHDRTPPILAQSLQRAKTWATNLRNTMLGALSSAANRSPLTRAIAAPMIEAGRTMSSLARGGAGFARAAGPLAASLAAGLTQVPGLMARTMGAVTSAVQRAAGRIGSLISAPFRLLANVQVFAFIQNIKALGGALMGAARSFTEFVESGVRASVVAKSFQSLTGTTRRGAEALARQLQAASQGALSLTESMAIANRAIAGGLSVDQISTAMDFISKKAFTTGKAIGESLNTVITGLSRGSVLFLDDFGVLVDGTEQVKRNYDAIKGSGAFDSLGPAAQKAEIVRAAIEDMRRQMGRMGVTGRETAFEFARIGAAFRELRESMGQVFEPLARRGAEAISRLAGSLNAFVRNNMLILRDMFTTSITGAADGMWRGFQAVIRPIRSALLGAMDPEEMAARLSAFAAKLPLWLARAFLTIERSALRLLGTLSGKAADVIGALIVPMSSLVAKLTGSKEEGEKFAEAMFGASNNLNRLMGSLNRQAREVDQSIEGVDENLRKVDDTAQVLIDRFHRNRVFARWAEDAADSADVMRNRWANVFRGFAAIADPFRQAMRGVASETGRAVDGLRDKMRAAADRVKEAADQLRAIQREMGGDERARARRRLDIQIAGLEARGDQVGVVRARMQHAMGLMAQARNIQDPEEALGVIGEARDVFFDLARQAAQNRDMDRFGAQRALGREAVDDPRARLGDFIQRMLMAAEATHEAIQNRRLNEAKIENADALQRQRQLENEMNRERLNAAVEPIRQAAAIARESIVEAGRVFAMQVRGAIQGGNGARLADAIFPKRPLVDLDALEQNNLVLMGLAQ